MSSENNDKRAVAVDYETFYDSSAGYSLTKMPTDAYCRDSRFDPYLVAICGEDIFKTDPSSFVTCDKAPGVYKTLEDGRQLYVGKPGEFRYWHNLEGRTLVAHNASFDSAVFDECVRRGITPPVGHAGWQCTADLSAYLLAPRSLKGAMKTLFGKEISKAVRAGMDGRHDWELDAADYEALVKYGGDDAVECHDLWLEYSGLWPEVERLISSQNRDAIRDGVCIDREYAERALKELTSYQARVLCDIPWTSEINPKTKEFYKPGSLPALRRAVIDLGIEPPKSFKKDDPGFLEWESKHTDIPFIKARQIAVALAMHIARIEGILRSLDENGRAHPSFLYFGAHTGRFSGKSDTSGVNINMLNMPRKPVFHGNENVFGGEGVDIRGMYIPRPGYKLAVYDYSQIEARFSLGLVKDDRMVDALRREGNLYRANAVEMGWCAPGEDIKKTDPDKYRLAKCCLTGDTLVLVRSKKLFGKGLTRPHYKRITCIKSTDLVWDGHEWVSHLGVERMKYVKRDELIETGGVCLTRDHRVYINDTESRRADEVFGDTETAAVSWGQANNPVRGWSHVRVLASALAGACARALYLGAREVLHLLARPVSVHGVRTGDATPVGQCAQGSDDPVHEVRSQSLATESRTERVGEGA